MSEQVTDETRIGQAYGGSYMMATCDVQVKQLFPEFRQRLLNYDKLEAELKEAKEDIKFRDIDCGCNARICELKAELAKQREMWEKLKSILKENQEGVGDGTTEALADMAELEKQAL